MNRARSSVVHGALLLSGSAALVYESAWGRMLHRVLGISDFAVAAVLAAFFLGMGLGGGLGTWLVRRAHRPARAYAMLEIGVAVWALLSLPLLDGSLHAYAWLGEDASFTTLSATRLFFALLVLLPPTTLMGATLPVVVAALREEPDWSDRATSLYTTNTIGAVIGASATGFLLLPTLGTRLSIVLAAATSALAGLIVLATLGREVVAPLPRVTARARIGAPHLLGFVMGATALAGEVLFTRTLRLVIQGTSQAFAAMLSCYLVGIVLGAFAVRRFRIGADGALAAIGRVQLVLAALVTLAMATTPQIPRIVGLLHGRAEIIPHRIALLLVVAAIMLVPLATALGACLPLIFRYAEQTRGDDGETGGLLAANTIGGLVGALLAGLVLVPTLGLEWSLRGLTAVHLVVSAVALVASAGAAPSARVTMLLGPMALAGLIVLARPSIHLPFLLDAWYQPTEAIIEGASSRFEDEIIYMREGRHTTVSVLRRDGTLRLFNDGRPESGISDGTPIFGPELAMLGGLPSLLARDTGDAMMIGLGAGHSTTMLLAGPWRHVDVVELEPAVVEAARKIHTMSGNPFPLDERARARLIVDDARARLMMAGEDSYDAILSQPSHPWLAGTSALYTREFAAQARRCLRPGGVLALWVNLFRMETSLLRRVVATLQDAFPHVAAFVVEDSSFILVASDEPIRLGQRAVERIDASPRLRTILSAHQLDSLGELIGTIELDPEGARIFARGARPFSDDAPELEYRLAALPHADALTLPNVDDALAHVPWASAATMRALPAWLRDTAALYRLGRLEGRRVGIHRVDVASRRFGLDAANGRLLDGAIAETRGDTARALALYDAVPLSEAAYRADALRVADGAFREALVVARGRAVVPADATPLLSAALLTGDVEDARYAVGVARRAERGADTALLAFVEAWSTGGCARLTQVLIDPPSLQAEALAMRARCASAVSDVEEAERASLARAYVRRASAQSWYDRGVTTNDGGNTALSVRFFRRALWHWPAHRESSERLADALCALDRCPAARVVLVEALEASRFFPGTAAKIREQATRLDLELD